MNQQTGKYIIVFGVIIIAVGVIIWLFGNKLNFIGRLPGDIAIKKENFSLYFPITTMILFSILLTLILWIIRRINS
jgi:hypothetical protein